MVSESSHNDDIDMHDNDVELTSANATVDISTMQTTTASNSISYYEPLNTTLQAHSQALHLQLTSGMSMSRFNPSSTAPLAHSQMQSNPWANSIAPVPTTSAQKEVIIWSANPAVRVRQRRQCANCKEAGRDGMNCPGNNNRAKCKYRDNE